MTQEGEAAANQELATVVNSLTPAQQRVYETAVFEGQDPYEALKALSERAETQNIHLEGVSDRALAIAVNSLTPAQQREYEAAVFEGQDPYEALKALSERAETQNIHLEGVSERGLATVVNSLTPAQQREYEAAVFEGQDPYDALNTLRERTDDPEHPPGGRLRAWAGHRRELYDPGPAAGIRGGGLRGPRPLRCTEGAFGADRDPEHPPTGRLRAGPGQRGERPGCSRRNRRARFLSRAGRYHRRAAGTVAGRGQRRQRIARLHGRIARANAGSRRGCAHGP